MNITGLMLLPVALGLPLSRRHGTHTALFVVGAFSVGLFDTDYFSGLWLRYFSATYWPQFPSTGGLKRATSSITERLFGYYSALNTE